MRKIKFLGLAIIVLCAVCSIDADAQRRARPGSMKHSDAELKQAMKKTKLRGTYIHDGATFAGPVYMVGDAGGIKIGDCSISFRGGKFYLNHQSGTITVHKHAAMTEQERIRKGITKYEYENSTEQKKLGDDFGSSGKYEIIEQYGDVNLILYDGDSENVFAKIPLSGASASSFEYTDGEFLFRFNKK